MRRKSSSTKLPQPPRMFPKIIHQTARSNDFPPLIAKCVDSLNATNPGWESRFYDDDDWQKAITPDSIFTWEDLMRYPTGIQRADIFRCAALYEYGGCYADVDMLGVRSLDSFLSAAWDLGIADEETEVILTIDHPVHSRLYFGRQKIYMNNFMLAKPGARFLEVFLREMKDAVRCEPCSDHAPVYTTGPVAMTEIIRKHGGPEALKIAVVPYFWINPIPDMINNFPERILYARMIEDGSWRTELAPYFIHCWWHSYINFETESYYGKLFDFLPTRRSEVFSPAL